MYIQVIAVVAPFVIIAVVAIFMYRSPIDLHNGTLGLLVSVSFTLMLTEIIKVRTLSHVIRCYMQNGTHLCPYT